MREFASFHVLALRQGLGLSGHPLRCAAEHCTDASHILSTPVQVHSLSTLSTAHMPATWRAHPFKRTRSVSTPVQAHLVSTEHFVPDGEKGSAWWPISTT